MRCSTHCRYGPVLFCLVRSVWSVGLCLSGVIMTPGRSALSLSVKRFSAKTERSWSTSSMGFWPYSSRCVRPFVGWARFNTRLGRLPLVLLTFAGALWLLVHSHGNHPAAAKIQFHHSLLAIVGVSAALSKGWASWLSGASSHVINRWEIAWAGSVVPFGVLLLVYSQ